MCAMAPGVLQGGWTQFGYVVNWLVLKNKHEWGGILVGIFFFNINFYFCAGAGLVAGWERRTERSPPAEAAAHPALLSLGLGQLVSNLRRERI